MKNMKVSNKLITGFLLVIVLATIVGVTGIIGLNSMSNSAESMYSNMAIPMSDLALATVATPLKFSQVLVLLSEN